MKLLVYARVSTSEQAAGVSIEEQLARGRSWAAAMGHEVVGDVIDAGLSGATPPDDRELGKTGKRLIDAGLAQGIVAVSLDRFSRSLRHTLDLVDWAIARNCAIISLRESMDTASPSGRLVLNVLAAMHQFTREAIIEKTRAVVEYRKGRGLVIGTIPFGKRRQFDRLVDDPEEQKAIAYVKAFYAANPQATRNEATQFMRDHFGPHPRKKTAWVREDVDRISRKLVQEGQIPRSAHGWDKVKQRKQNPTPLRIPDIVGQTALFPETGAQSDGNRNSEIATPAEPRPPEAV